MEAVEEMTVEVEGTDAWIPPAVWRGECQGYGLHDGWQRSVGGCGRIDSRRERDGAVQGSQGWNARKMA